MVAMGADKASMKVFGETSNSPTFASLCLLALFSQAIDKLLKATRVWYTIGTYFSRIQKFLNLPEAEDRRQVLDETHSEKRNEINKVVQFCEVKAMAKIDGKIVLNQLNFALVRGSFTLVLGMSGAGKSMLLRTIMGGTIVISGTVKLTKKSVAYCGQSSWIQNKSIQETIVGNAEFDEDWYRRVLAACLLTEAIARLPNTDQTIVGRNGSRWSEALQQRLVSIVNFTTNGKRVILIFPRLWQERYTFVRLFYS